MIYQVEIAETLEEALVREIREETGCLVKQYDQIQTVTSLYHYNEDNVNKCI
ncbi:NUDIX domain-containing protein [Wolbachia endosymbiont of Cardiocondyla obscurior]|uniref:NUDIX domain-containing protein n=1 Tax=Wolbachia endosymbiont of Cardiocondyla obscurior TaxID=2687307 RepID=UPI00157A6858|nr:NUDIX domain-containing protein [Wolbachia endosymbiont of Cardiocondyla obscurior]